MKTLVAGAVAIAVLWLIWPYYALYDLANSLNQADQIGLARRIEWASVRQGLREDLTKFLMRNVAQEKTGQGSPGAALGASLVPMIGPVLIEKTLDVVVTPQAIAALIAQSKMAAPSDKVAGSAVTGEPPNNLKISMLKYAFFSSGPFDFKVAMASPTHVNEAPLVLLFRWSGDWRITRISVSQETIERIYTNSLERIYASTPNIAAKSDSALRALREALGGAIGGTTGGTQAEAPLGKFIEGLSKGFRQSTGEPSRDSRAIADELLKALSGGSLGVVVPQPEQTAPRPGATPPQPATPRSTPAPAPDLDRAAREILRDLLNR